MKRFSLATAVAVMMLAVFMGPNGTTASGSHLNAATRAVLATDAGHRQVGRLPSGAYQVSVEQRYQAVRLPTSGTAPQLPHPAPSADTLGCPNVYTSGTHGDAPPPNVRATQICDLRRQAEIALAVNPVDTSNVIEAQNDSRLGYNRQGIDWSIDTGDHWGDYQPPSTQVDTSFGGQWTYDAVSDPAVTHDADGNAYYALLGFDFLNDAATGLWVMKSDQSTKGSYFHSPSNQLGPYQQYADTPVGLVHDNFSNPALSDDKEFIVGDQYDSSPYRNNVYVTWTIFDFHCGSSGDGYCSSAIYFSRSDDGGATWSPAQVISGNNPAICVQSQQFDPDAAPGDCNNDQGSWPVVMPDGSLNVIFNNCNTSQRAMNGLPAKCQQLFVRSTNEGHTWSPPVRIGADYATEPLNGYTASLPNGCPVFRQCLPPNGYRMNNYPSMGLDESTGNLVAVWSDFRNGDYPSNSNEDVFFSMSTDDGATWSPPREVTQGGETAAQYFPWVDVDESGNIYVMYYDMGNGSCETDGCLDVTLATSTNDGHDWSYRRITTDSMPNLTPDNNPFQFGFIGDYNALVARGGWVHMGWADTRGLRGTVEEDAYYAKVPTVRG